MNEKHDCGCNETTFKTLVSQIEDNRKPYTEEIISETEKIRHFDPHLYEDHLFKWHFDEEDRWIEALNETDWQFQYDNELPIKMEVGKILFIPKGHIHRVIKGTNVLSVKIKT